MSTDPGNKAPRSSTGMLKFIILSLLGVFLFMFPIPDGEGAFTIPLGVVIDWLTAFSRSITFGDFSAVSWHLMHMIALVVITISFIGSLIALAKPKFITESELLKAAFTTSPIYFISKAIGFVFVWMLFLNMGPEQVIAAWTGDVMIGLVAGLVAIFIVLVPVMPLVTDFGLMEFIGILIRKFVRVLFTLPGRASVDLMASWFGSSAVSIIITRNQHDRGFYTGREAAVIAVNFSFVSLPFTFVVADTIGLSSYFLLFYLIMCITCVVLGLILPRIWPLRGIPDTYLEGVGKQIHEETPPNTSKFAWALDLAVKRAEGSGLGDVVKTAGKTYVNIFMDLIPVILAWGTLAIMVAELTPVFDWIAWPLGQYLSILGVEGGADLGHITLVGFIDMFLPALMMGDAPDMTRFILGILSIVQIIYLAETGVLIIKSKIPLGIGKLFIIFMMRTILALPIIVLLSRLLFSA